MPTIKKFEDMEIWQISRQISSHTYNLTRSEIFARDFGLSNQMRRAAVSIMSNIAEGFESRTNVLFKDYLGRAKASSGELRSQLYVAKDIGYISDVEFSQLFSLCERCTRQISRLIQYLEKQPNALRDYETEYDI